MIWIDNDAGYHSSKTIVEYSRHIRLIGIDMLAKSRDHNPIENL